MENKVLFIHAPKTDDPEDIVFSMPIGIVALADYLARNQIASRILHLGVEKKINPDFSLPEYAIKNRITVFCLDLHWHHQSYSVIELARQIKHYVKDSVIILGGFTASFFAREILAKFNCIDFIIRGDAEIPLLELIKKLKAKTGLNKIPNLVWRQNSRITENNAFYLINQKIIDTLNFTNFKLIIHAASYFKINLKYDSFSGYAKQFQYNCGRGCSFNCSYCGGSLQSQKVINRRISPVLISHGAVLKALADASAYGISCWNTSFCPRGVEPYYISLFRKIRKDRLNLSCIFDFWGLPGRGFINSFAQTFKNGSHLVISPESGSEEVRRRNKGNNFSNHNLMQALAYLEAKKVNTQLNFSIGLPFETSRGISQTYGLIKEIQASFSRVRVKVFPVELDPCSPAFLKSKLFNIKLTRNTFYDFYNYHCGRKLKVGYESMGLPEGKIIAIAESMLKYTTDSFSLKAKAI